VDAVYALAGIARSSSVRSMAVHRPELIPGAGQTGALRL